MDQNGDGLISEQEAEATRALRIPPSGIMDLTGLEAFTGLKMIGVDNMPMLTEVCVWTLPFPPEGVTVLRTYSPQVQFTTACTGDSQ